MHPEFVPASVHVSPIVGHKKKMFQLPLDFFFSYRRPRKCVEDNKKKKFDGSWISNRARASLFRHRDNIWYNQWMR